VARRAQLELTKQNEQLRDLDQMKDDLIALVSHELRTPLTSIVGYLELVTSPEAGELSEEQRHHLAVVERNAQRLIRVVSDLLLVAQVQAGQLNLLREDLDMSLVADECVNAVRTTAGARDIELTLVAAGGTRVLGDRQRVAQVLDNLLSNALKFTPDGGSVAVQVTGTDGGVVLTVADSGIGIPAAEQDQLFSRFFRSSTAMERAVQGTGLGLSIARAIVEAHGGEISVSSRVGEGSTFRVVLPAAAALAVQEPATAA
jgi:signal transduction histidine kinase